MSSSFKMIDYSREREANSRFGALFVSPAWLAVFSRVQFESRFSTGSKWFFHEINFFILNSYVLLSFAIVNVDTCRTMCGFFRVLKVARAFPSAARLCRVALCKFAEIKSLRYATKVIMLVFFFCFAENKYIYDGNNGFVSRWNLWKLFFIICKAHILHYVNLMNAL